MASEKKDETDDEYEEITLIADLKGVLDPASVTRALAQNNVALRFVDREQPVVQVGSSIYTGEWTKTLGTDMIYKGTKPPTSAEDTPKTYELLSHSSTRLVASKAISSTMVRFLFGVVFFGFLGSKIRA
jgi:hypothetical protein